MEWLGFLGDMRSILAVEARVRSLHGAQDNVILMRLGEESAKRILSEIAADTKNVKFTTHARERMKERQITSAQILRCLRHGRITEGPAREASGNWKLEAEC